MNEINKLVYFLNCIKKILPFKDTTDFKKQINENKEFRIKVQKMVFLSKFFGWDNSYHFNFHLHGPYSATLNTDYKKMNLFNMDALSIDQINLNKFISFIKTNSVEMLEAQSTLLYFINKMNIKNIDKKEALNILQSLKPHLSPNDISQSYDNLINFDLFKKNISHIDNCDLEELEFIVTDKAKGLMDIFRTLEVSSNRLFFLGSLDYFRIVLNEEKLDSELKKQLLSRFYDYADKLEEEYFKRCCDIEDFTYWDLTHLRNDFNELEEYVAYELKILPKFDDDSDLAMFF